MNYENIKEKMEKTISVFEENLAEIRAGRANPAILNKVKIDYLWGSNSNFTSCWYFCT